MRRLAMLTAFTASITHDDAHQAGRDLAAELLDGLEGPPDVILLFASTAYDPHALLAGLHAALPGDVPLVGCSSYAEISQDQALAGSATAMGLRLGGRRVHTLRSTPEQTDNFAIGQALGEQAKACDAALVIVLVDGIHRNSTPVLAGLQSVLGVAFPIVGGVAADDARFTKTYEFCDRDVLEGGVVALAIQGPLHLATVAHGGW